MLVTPLQAQTLSGEVTDRRTGQPLEGASVLLRETGQGTVTGPDGRFRIAEVAPGFYTVQIRFLGFEPVEVAATVPQIAPLSISLRESTVQGQELIVTGSPLGSAVRYQSAQAFGSEALQRRSATSIGDMLDGESGISMRSFGPVPARPVLRGFDGDRLVMLENGERFGDLAETAADHAIATDPLAADRIEVVRGPASLLYGTGAIGGVINVISDDVPGAWQHGLTGETAFHSSSASREGALFGRARYGADRWTAGGRLAVRGSGDVRTPMGVLPGTFGRTVDGGGGAAYAHGGTEAGFFVSGQNRIYGLPEGLDDPDESVEIRLNRLAGQGHFRLRGTGFWQVLEVRANSAGYAHEEIAIEGREEDVGLRFDLLSVSSTAVAQHGRLGPFARGAIGGSVFARDLRVSGEEVLTPDGQTLTGAVFVFQEADVLPGLSVQAALRGELQRLSVRPNAAFDLNESQPTATTSAALGLNARPLPELELGLQVAQAFRAPTLEERYSDGPHLGAGAFEIGNPDLATERALGIDGFVRVASGPLRVEAAAFATRLRDFVVYQPTGAVDPGSELPIFVYTADAARQLGAELDLALALGRGFSALAVADVVSGTRLSDDMPLPRIPPARARLALALEQPGYWSGISVRAVAHQNRTAPNEEATDGYVLLGMEGGFRLGPANQHVVALRLDNALNTSYRDHLSRVEGRDLPMPGRNLSVTYRTIW